ncbi:hypothetical protein M408DRAFT_29809 [Serendipita vermifera MAFF 305830]|uniref:GDP/GTP exchange factor Sec2 N-terminal domain-containing protein n=1 Tax=Serendipita vermifera MAFF 305830 TaxID=933852 RepID=A0A0C3AM44_SERVB|nr:hypothetical protein M408DRAFT_29809 [Serendipita vermifera MAFF 305830]
MNLEREKSVLEMKQEQMVKDGRLVARSAVAAELTRLMEESMASSNAKLSTEAKHKQMESELSDLSANLFSTANEMVATERQLRASVEESLTSTKGSNALLEKQLEAAQLQLGGTEREKEILREQAGRTEKETEELRKALRGINSSNFMSQGTGGILRMMISHAPYKNEYLGFLAHLRGTMPNVPAVTSLLTLPFLARLAVEDSEPTLRLDLAPSLNWLTRRSALAAINSNTLLIEQIHVATLFLEGSAWSYSYGGFGTTSSLPASPTQLTKPCALRLPRSRPSVAPSPQRSVSAGGWGASQFLKSVTLPSLGSVVSGSGSSGSRSNSPAPRHSLDSIPTPISSTNPLPPFPIDRPYSPPPPTSLQTVIHAFRIPITGKSANTSTTNLAGPDASQSTENYGPPYPLCHTGWCLSRLRATLDLWGCVKSEAIERVWVDGELERRPLGNGSGITSWHQRRQSGATRPSETTNTQPLGIGRDALDKAKAYGSGSPGSDGAVVTPTTASSTSAAGFLGGVRRTFSGSAILPSSTGSAVSDPEKTTAGNDNTAITGEAGTGAIRAPAVPRRSIGRLSAVFTGAAQPSEAVNSGGVQGAEATPNQDVQVQNTDVDPVKPPTEKSLASPPIAPSASLDTFVTPFESPRQMLSPDPGDDTTKHGANSEALITAIEGHLSSSKQDSVDFVSPSSPEPPTPTPTSIGFGSGTTGASARHSHVRNTSIASIISEGNTVTPRPSTPSTESKLLTKAGSRPSTPGKTGVPPPVPRRPAARNAARTSIVAAPESPNQPPQDGTGDTGEPDAATKAGDTVMAIGAEPGLGKVDEEGAMKEGVDGREADAETAYDAQE